MFLAATLMLVIVKAADFPRVSEPCTSDADCFDDYESCGTDGLTEGKCEHKDVYPANALESIGGYVVIFILCASNMGGLGGGGAVIPLAMIFFGFNTKESISLSNASLCVASICRYFVNWPKTHPYKNGTGVLVDYNIASLMLPMIVVGATTGVMVNKVLPSVVIAVILTILLLAISYMTLRMLLRI